MEKFGWTETIKTNLFLLKIVGLWPESNEGYKCDFYAFYSFVSVNLFVIPHVIFQTINFIYTYSNLEALAVTILICLAEILAIIKIYTFIKNIKMVKQLLVTLNKKIFQPRNLSQIMLVKPDLDFWKNIYHTLLSAVCPAMLLWFMAPFLNGSFKDGGLPFDAWYPFNHKAQYYYELAYLHQILGTFLLAVGDYNIDMLISALMMYVGAQCDILCDDLKNLDREPLNVKENLINSIERHKAITKFAEECNRFFNFMLLGQFFTSSLCMATSLFRMALITPSSFEFYTLFCSIMSLILQIFTYCWFGNEVELKSSKIPYSIFESNWIHQPLSIKKNLMIMTRRTLVPIKFSTFNLFYLTLDTFMTIMRSAVSYFTVLRQLNAPEK